jgi:transcription initiation factor IIE alpha subunit
MNIRDKKDDVLFMSTGLFEHLSDAESYVFSHVAFFACQKEGRFKGNFKQTTRAICNKVGYSPNTVRKALEDLIEKKFLSKVEEEEPTLKYNYIDKVAHKLTIGEADYAVTYANSLAKMLKESVTKQKEVIAARDMTFFKVNVGKLRRDTDTVIDKKEKNLSKHFHKTLILHGYLYNQTSWNKKRNRTNVSRGVAFLSAAMQWSQNTVRRVINTLSDLGAIGYSYATKTVTFTFVSVINAIKGTSKKLRTKLCLPNKESTQKDEPAKTHKVSSQQQTPAQAAQFLKDLRERQEKLC